jgi:hypothetical protein
MHLFSFELVALFRLCEGQPKLLTHLHGLAPFREVKDSIFSSEDYVFHRPMLTYLNCHFGTFANQELMSELLFFAMGVLREHKQHE